MCMLHIPFEALMYPGTYLCILLPSALIQDCWSAYIPTMRSEKHALVLVLTIQLAREKQTRVPED